MNIKPMGDKVVVKSLNGERITPSKIILLESKEAFEAGEVMAIGQGRKTEDGKIIPMEVKVGDKVYYNKLRGQKVRIEMEEYLIIKEEHLLCTL